MSVWIMITLSLTGPVALVGLAIFIANLQKLRKENKELLEKLAEVEQHISATVEERLVSHAKYCEKVDALVQKQLEVEEAKWRELVSAATCRMKEIITKARSDLSEKQKEDHVEIMHELEKQMMNFQGLLKQSYLDEYEKMRHNPPRPKKGPRKKIDPPQRFRSLDDDFSFCATEEPQEK